MDDGNRAYDYLQLRSVIMLVFRVKSRYYTVLKLLVKVSKKVLSKIGSKGSVPKDRREGLANIISVR